MSEKILDERSEIDLIMRGVKAMYVDADAVTGEEEIYNFEHAQKALETLMDRVRISELELLKQVDDNWLNLDDYLKDRLTQLKASQSPTPIDKEQADVGRC